MKERKWGKNQKPPEILDTTKRNRIPFFHRLNKRQKWIISCFVYDFSFSKPTKCGYLFKKRNVITKMF